MIKEQIPQGSVHLLTGVAGLNEMIAGGYQEYTVTAIIGESGTGRTTMALQFLVEGMLNGEAVLYMSLAHDPGRLRKKLAEMYPGIESVLASKMHAFRLDPKSFDSLSNYLGNALPELVTELGITRMVIDPLTLYEDSLIEGEFSIMSIHQIYWTLKTLPCTSIVVLESNTNNPLQSSNGHSEKFADNVIFLFRDYPEKDYLKPYRKILLVMKTRYSDHDRAGRLISHNSRGIISVLPPHQE